MLAVFTDCGNSTGSTSFQDLIANARASQVTIYVVGVLVRQSESVRGELELRMRRIADETGGRAIFPYSLKQIDEAYDRMARSDVRYRFVIDSASLR